MDELAIRRIVNEEVQKIFGQSFSLPLGFERALEKRLGRFLFGSKTINFGNINSNASSTSTITVIGARPNDPVILGLPTGGVNDDDIKFDTWVSANDTITIRAYNADDTNTKNSGSGTYTVAVLKKSNV